MKPITPGQRDGVTEPIRAALKDKQTMQSAVVLLAAPLLLTLWVYYGKRASFTQFFGAAHLPLPADAAAALYEYLAAFTLMFIIPAILARAVFKVTLRDLGLRWGDAKAGARLVAIFAPVLLLMAFLSARSPAMQAEYPLARSMMSSAGLFLLVEAGYLIYYLGWEFFFRGFMLFMLEKPYGAVIAILIQTIPSTIVHIGKPASENFAAILAGVVFGLVAVRTRSIIYPMILHAIVGIGTDIFITLLLT